MDINKPRYIPMSRRRRIYEGKAKVLFEGPEPGTLVQYFKDDATAFNNQKKGVITGKGVLNNRISEYLFQRLNDIGVPTHFIRRLNMREQLIREIEIIPLSVVVRNVAAGSLATRLGIEEGTQLPRSIIEFYYKNDKLDKDRFRRDLGGLIEAYTDVAKRLGIMSENERPQGTGPVLVKG